MEWGELLPEDRRTLKALLGLNDDGTRSVTSSDAAPVSSRGAASDAPTCAPAEPPRMTVSLLKKGIESQVAKVAKHWTVVRAVRRSYGRAIRVAEFQSSIRSIMETIYFKGFLVVYAQVTFSVVPWLVSKKRPQTDEDAHCEPAPRVVDSLVLPPCEELSNAVDRTASRCLARVTVHTMQFVHRDDDARGFEVQSVVVPGEPLALQCVAGIMIQFGLLCFLRLNYRPKRDPAPTLLKEGLPTLWDVTQLRGPTSGTILVLGMGGNVMANCLLRLVPVSVSVHVAEIEPSVVATCMLEGLLPQEAPNFSCQIGDVANVMASAKEGSCAIIFLDCFDPVAQDVLTARELLSRARRLLRRPCPSVDKPNPETSFVDCSKEGGQPPCLSSCDDDCSGSVLIVNLHQRPSKASLAVFFEIFGADCVEVVDLFQSRQCFVACAVSPFLKIDVQQLHRLIDVVNQNGASVWRGGADGAKMKFDENTAAAVRRISHATGVASRWVAADDTQ